MNEEKIQLLLNRFMAGKTSIDEEQTLAQYFREGNIKAEWADYKAMFDYFDAGMPLDNQQQPLLANNEKRLKRRKKTIRYALIAALSAAALIALLFTIALPNRQTDGNERLANNRNSQTETVAMPQKKAEKATIAPSVSTKKKHTNNAEKRAKPAKRTKKHAQKGHFYMPAPTVYYANAAPQVVLSADHSDSLAPIDSLVDSELIANYLQQCAALETAMDVIYEEEIEEEQTITEE